MHVYMHATECETACADLCTLPISTAAPDLQSYLKSVPTSTEALDQLLDWAQDGVECDLSEIADHMLGWERLAVHLELTPVNISDIKEKYPNQPELQRHVKYLA